MKNIILNIKDNYKLAIGVLIAGMFLGWLFFHSSEEAISTSPEIEGHEGHNHESADPATWTCSMHPQIRQDEPGQCPICAMDLIPVTIMSTEGDDIDPNEIIMSESAIKLAEIQTLVVSKGIARKTLSLQGKVQADERNISEITARFGGRIEKLFINFTGQNVRKGEKMATIYSPDLITAQRELLEVIAFKESRPSLYSASKTKLKLWDLSDEQIRELEEKGEPEIYFDILSPVSGTVSMRHVAVGDYINEGTPLFKVVDLSKVWLMFDAYESDLPWINLGDKVDISINALPGENFTTKISFIDPFIDGKTRVAKVRVDLSNPNLKLKPEMFAHALLESIIAENKNEILIPKSSILWTGKRAIVYVKVPNRETSSFIYREVVLGPEAGSFYVISEGLSEGEEIAVNGVFKIDASAQLAGKPSMMNPDGGKVSTGHNHGDMGISGSENREMTAVSDEHASHNMDTEEQHESFRVGGNCGMCKDRIEAAAISVDGVIDAIWNKETKIIHVSFDNNKTSLRDIHKAIALVGHDTDMEQATNEVYDELPGCCLYERFEYSQTATTVMEHAMIKVLGNCDMCKDRIETAALSVLGVETANWDADTQMIHLNFNSGKTNSNEIQKEIAKVGHDTENYKAPDDVYEELPGCCLYIRDAVL